MRRLATLAVLGMLGTALLVSSTFAQQNASLGVEGKADLNRQFTKVGGIYVNGSGDTIVVRQRLTENGYPIVEPSSPLNRDANLTFQNAIPAISLASGAADSSVVLDTHGMRLGMLLLKITPGTGTGTLTRIAVQIRVHLGGVDDSVSTFPIYFNSFKDAPTVVSGAADTSNAGHQLAGSATAPWSGEFVVTASSGRNSPGSVVAATAWQYPNGIAIPLNNIWGREVYAPYISIRVRNMVGPTAVVTAHLVGTPL